MPYIVFPLAMNAGQVISIIFIVIFGQKTKSVEVPLAATMLFCALALIGWYLPLFVDSLKFF